MNPLPIVLITAAVIALGLVVFFSVRKPTVATDIRDMNKDVQRGARDAYNGTKDAAEDVKDTIKDAAK